MTASQLPTRAARRVVGSLLRERERERLLDDIFCQRRVATDAVEHERVQAIDVGVVEPLDRVSIACLGGTQIHTWTRAK